uniref:Uncharacterized protein n=1 Tax=Fagus sylvatica TaxID=28930 RepID=A0A2N9GF01_FAGSY
MDWLNSVSFLPSFLDDPYHPGWWDESHDLIDTSTTLTSLTNTATLTSITQSEDPTISNHPSPSEDSSKKRKTSSDPLPKPSQTHHRKNHSLWICLQPDGGDAAAAVDQEVAVTVKKSVGNKRSTNKSTANNCHNGNNKADGLNSYSILAPPQSLTTTCHASTSSIAQNVPTFASTDSRLFQRSLLIFYEVSPSFAFPNNIANACILQILAQQPDRLRRPPGDNFSTQLLAFAKSMNVNLQINRLHGLNHNTLDERTEFLRVLKSMEPKGMILSENNMECSCNNCGNFANGFSRRVEYLWRFLDSTSSAFKGRVSDERKVMEREAAKALTNKGVMNEGKDKWCERMRGVGFVVETFGEDAIEWCGRALLRKYDGNWEMRFVGRERWLCGIMVEIGQPVSFCSLWKLDMKANDGQPVSFCSLWKLDMKGKCAVMLSLLLFPDIPCSLA